MNAPVRLFDHRSKMQLVVDAAKGQVFADKNGDGKIDASERLDGDLARDALKAVRQIDELFVVAAPGTLSPDRTFEVRGELTQQETKAIRNGGAVQSERDALKLHLDFFDRDLDGKMSVGENFRGWRELGFGTIGAGVKTLMSAMMFGKMKDGFAVDVEAIGLKRYASATGIYDKEGRLNRERLNEYLAAFTRPLTQAEVLKLLEDKSPNQGMVSKGQFRSLFEVCARLNKGDKVVTREQFRGLFDGSLLWIAASTTDDEGRRKLQSTREAHCGAVTMESTFASDLDELKNWVDGVRQLPRFLRTKDAKALFDALEGAGIKSGADLKEGVSVDDIAAKVGRTKDNLLASLRKCPFGL